VEDGPRCAVAPRPVEHQGHGHTRRRSRGQGIDRRPRVREPSDLIVLCPPMQITAPPQPAQSVHSDPPLEGRVLIQVGGEEAYDEEERREKAQRDGGEDCGALPLPRRVKDERGGRPHGG
jgi:hypothetical protein